MRRRTGRIALVIVTIIEVSVITSTVVATSGGASAQCLPPPPGLVSWWPGEGDGADIAGGNPGSIQGLATTSPGKVGQAFDFAAGGHVDVPHDPELDVNAPGFTTEFWMLGMKNQPESLFDVVDKSHGCVDSLGWTFQGDSTTGDLTFAIGSGGPGALDFVSIVAGLDLLDGMYHHVAGSWESATGTMELYVDGTLRDTATQLAPANNTRSLRVGSWHCGRQFVGIADEVSIYDRALSSDEIRAIFDADEAGKCRGDAFEPNDSIAQATPIGCPFDTDVVSIEPQGDVDFYSIALQAGEAATFDLEGECGLPGGSSLELELEILNALGTSLAFDNACDPLIGFVAPSDGTYFASVRDAGSSEGDYQLLVSCAGVCGPEPKAGCVRAEKASVAIVEKKPGKEKLKATLKGFDRATEPVDFGDPVGEATRYDLCLYDGAGDLAGELSVDQAGMDCGTKQKPCWKTKSDKGYTYKDPEASASGVKKIAAVSGPVGKGKLQVQAGNKLKKGQTEMPTGVVGALQGATSASMQVVTSDGLCFEAVLGNVKKNNGTQFKAKAP